MNWFRNLFNQTFNIQEPDSDEEEKSQVDDSDQSIIQQQRNRRVSQRPAGPDMTKKQRLAEMEKRGKVLKDQFREILYRNVCMSLFERHKLLFAFFISLKVFERDQSF